MSTSLGFIKDLLLTGRLIARIRKGEAQRRGLVDYFRTIQTTSLSPIQKEVEIVSLLRRASRLRIRAVCEIGTGPGGTMCLLSKVALPSATLITVDVSNDWRKAIFLRSLVRVRQKIHVVTGDSRDPCVLKRVGGLLGKQRLDLLFIDGDHAYESVKSDFELYSGLVKEGGWIAFHDIIPDYGARYGIKTQSQAGGVPLFWNQTKGSFPNFEIVEDYGQDACGIGVLEFRYSHEGGAL
jgi:predicted O-methyltransferase YrrM